MMSRISTLLAGAAVALFLALPASADTVNIYQIGSSADLCGANTAYDPAGNCISGSATVSWTNIFSGAPGSTAYLTILAEGIDQDEMDNVFVNGTLVGSLTQQSFRVPYFNLSNSNAGTGPLDLDGDAGDSCVTGPTSLPCDTVVTDLTLSVFDVTGLVNVGSNLIQVVTDPNNWVNEIDAADLSGANVPEPSSMTLLLLGGGVLAFIRRRFI